MQACCWSKLSVCAIIAHCCVVDCTITVGTFMGMHYSVFLGKKIGALGQNNSRCILSNTGWAKVVVAFFSQQVCLTIVHQKVIFAIMVFQDMFVVTKLDVWFNL